MEPKFHADWSKSKRDRGLCMYCVYNNIFFLLDIWISRRSQRLWHASYAHKFDSDYFVFLQNLSIYHVVTHFFPKKYCFWPKKTLFWPKIPKKCVNRNKTFYRDKIAYVQTFCKGPSHLRTTSATLSLTDSVSAVLAKKMVHFWLFKCSHDKYMFIANNLLSPYSIWKMQQDD